MSRYISLRKGLAGLTTALLLAPFALFAADSTVVDDCEGGTNKNKLNYYWYYYDDSGDGGNSKITADKDADGKYVFAPVASEGVDASFAAKITYQMGDTKPKSGANEYDQMVGIGTMFCKDGGTLDMTGATAITFWAKASEAMDLVIELKQSDITDFSYHFSSASVTTQWAMYTIDLTKLQNQTWGAGKKGGIAFSPSKAQGMQWKISLENSVPESGTLWLDNVVFQGVYIPIDICTSCLTTAGTAPTGCLLSNLNDAKDASVNNAGYYWYCYTDKEGRPAEGTASAFTEGVDETGEILTIDGNGYGTDGNGAYVKFQLGTSYLNGTNTVQPFAGLGTMLQEDQKEGSVDVPTPFDASSYTGIYFDYKTSASVTQVRIEVPAQKIAKEGAVHYVNLPGTNGEWKGAKIPFSEFHLPDWDGVEAEAINKAKVQKIQWAVQSNPQLEGALWVDNVYFTGASSTTCPGLTPDPVKKALSRSQKVGMNYVQTAKNLAVSMNLPTGNHNGLIELVNVNGRVILKQDIKAVGGVNATFNLGYSKLPAGAYILKVKTAYGEGKTFTASDRISVIK